MEHMEELSNSLDALIESLGGHLSLLPDLRHCHEDLDEATRQLKGRSDPHFRYTIKQVHSRHTLQAQGEIAGAILDAIGHERYTVAEALSRVGIEHAVNLIYVAEDTDAGRAKSLLKHHIDDARRRAVNWAKAGMAAGMPSTVDAAHSKLDYVDALRRSNPALVSDRPGWPDARTRFGAVGLELHYHTIFAAASDSVHALAEDVLNLSILESGPPILVAKRRKALLAEKASFAIYLGTQALWFYSEALGRLARMMADDACLEAACGIGGRLQAMLDMHESHHRQTWRGAPRGDMVQSD